MRNECFAIVTAMFVVALAVASPSDARAEAADSAPTTDKSTSTQLFKEGRGLMEQGHLFIACPKLEESQRLDPGGGTLLNVALCHEKQGKTASAWGEFTEALGIAKRDARPQRSEFARVHLAQLETVLSRVVIQVDGAADVPDLEIKRDGNIVARAAWGSAIPVDPGDHIVEASAPGKVGWKQAFVLSPKADSKTLIIPVLEEALPRDHGSASPPAGAESVQQLARSGINQPPATLTAAPRAADAPRSSAVPGWLSVGVGVAALTAGSVFGLRAIDQKNDAVRLCPGDSCSADGVSKNNEAIRSANVATVGFCVGALGVGLGSILLLSRAAEAPAAPSSLAGWSALKQISVGARGVQLTGDF